MIGAIAGDMIGSPYEAWPIKDKDFPLRVADFTDDTVLTVAVADALLGGGDFAASLRRFARRYPGAGYGGRFRKWMWIDDPAPYNSFGNGSAMRVSPVGFAFDTAEAVLTHARRSAAVSHNHPEGLKGAQAAALSIFMARMGESKEAIRKEISRRFGYDLNRSVDDIRPTYRFDITCQGSVPESIICFLDSESWEDAVRNAVSMGGDADTMACIAGGISQAYYGQIPAAVRDAVRAGLPADLLQVVDRFNRAYACRF